jgi:hypothetical protein
MLPVSSLAKRNRRGCFLMIGALVLALALVGYLATQTADTARSDEAVSEGAGTPVQR